MRVFLVFLLLLLSRASSFPQNVSTCPNDSFYYLSSCFAYFDRRMNWAQAQDMCQQRGLHLMTIQKSNEASVIAPLVKKYKQNENIWIRLEKPIQNKKQKFTHRPGNGQHKPSKGQEVTTKKEVCVELVAKEGFLKWNNLACKERRPFLCQTLPLHSEFWMEEINVTKLSKVTESNEKNKDYKFTTKYGGKIREKTTTKEDKKIKESLFTNNHSSEKSLTSFLMVSLVFISFLISFFPKVNSPKQDLQT